MISMKKMESNLTSDELYQWSTVLFLQSWRCSHTVAIKYGMLLSIIGPPA